MQLPEIISQRESGQEFVSRQFSVGANIPENRAERAYLDGIVVRDRDVMLSSDRGCQPNMAAGLASDLISQTCQCANQ